MQVPLAGLHPPETWVWGKHGGLTRNCLGRAIFLRFPRLARADTITGVKSLIASELARGYLTISRKWYCASPFMDLDGNAIPDIQILGYGRSELEVLHDGMAVKMPFRCKSSTDDDEKVNIKVIQREQDVYRRLGCCDGVVMVSSHQYLQYDYSTCIHGKWRPHILCAKSTPWASSIFMVS